MPDDYERGVRSGFLCEGFVQNKGAADYSPTLGIAAAYVLRGSQLLL